MQCRSERSHINQASDPRSSAPSGPDCGERRCWASRRGVRTVAATVAASAWRAIRSVSRSSAVRPQFLDDWYGGKARPEGAAPIFCLNSMRSSKVAACRHPTSTPSNDSPPPTSPAVDRLLHDKRHHPRRFLPEGRMDKIYPQAADQLSLAIPHNGRGLDPPGGPSPLERQKNEQPCDLCHTCDQ